MTVLIADDEALERRAIVKILSGHPEFDVVEAENGVQALAVVGRSAVAVALLDIKMPGLDGLAVAEALRRDHPDVAIVFLTAYDQFDYARGALRLQVDDFLLKPASADEVLATLGRAVARTRTREGLRQSAQAALVRLETAVELMAQRLRDDLVAGFPGADQVSQFLELQGLEGRPLAALEGRPSRPGEDLHLVVPLAEAWFGQGDGVALAAVCGAVVRILVLGGHGGEDLARRVAGFRDRARTEAGCFLSLGAGVNRDEASADALVAAAHRAATVAGPHSPVVVGVSHRGPAPAPLDAPPVVTRALEVMEARLTEDPSLNEVAGAVGVSPSHLSRQLARATGKGFADCLAQFRVAAAKRYLASGTLAVKEVAHLVGFHDPAYFARVFRRLEGRSPADYRGSEGGGR
jgi:two-component system response regulator YesN